MTEEKIQELHRQCVMALHQYTEEEKKTCSVLEALEFPLGHRAMIQMLDQRQVEMNSRAASSPHIFSALLKCGACGSN